MTARHRAAGAPPPRRPLRRAVGAVASGGVALLLLTAALLVGPLPVAAAQTAPPTATLLRLAQLTPSPPSVELVVSSVANPRESVLAATLRYGEVVAYRAVEPGDYVVTMRPAGSTAPPAVSRNVTVEAGTVSTVASVRHTKTPDDLGVFTDDLTPPAPDRARVRVINAVPSAPQLDVRDADARPVALALPHPQASPYREVTPGATRWTVGPPSGETTPLVVTLAPNQVASVVLTGDGDGPRATVVVDAGGPATVPPGPVHAGLGGAAGTPPGATVGSAVLTVLAALAAGVSVRLARRAG